LNENKCPHYDQLNFDRDPPCKEHISKFFENTSIFPIKETYLAVRKKKRAEFPQDHFETITLTAGSVLAPDPPLLNDVKFLQKEFEKKGLPKEWARWAAWDASDYTTKYLDQINEDEEAQERIYELIQKILNGEAVWLVCYEKFPPCHRFVLWRYIRGKISLIDMEIALETKTPRKTLDDFMRL
jgi:hypothetical protein